jgi:exoribonuclease R
MFMAPHVPIQVSCKGSPSVLLSRIVHSDKDNPRRRLDSILEKWVKICALAGSSYEMGQLEHGMFGCQYTCCTSPVRRLCDAIIDQHIVGRKPPVSALMIRTMNAFGDASKERQRDEREKKLLRAGWVTFGACSTREAVAVTVPEPLFVFVSLLVGP